MGPSIRNGVINSTAEITREPALRVLVMESRLNGLSPDLLENRENINVTFLAFGIKPPDSISGCVAVDTVKSDSVCEGNQNESVQSSSFSLPLTFTAAERAS
jgi:hypothetical protein